MKSKRLALMVILISTLGAGIIYGCKRTLNPEEDYEAQKPGVQRTTSNSAMSEEIIDDNAFPNAANFFNEALSTEGVQDDYPKDDFLLYSETVANYLYITRPDGEQISSPYSNGKFTLNLATTSEGIALLDGINGFLGSLEQELTEIAGANGFSTDENITFGSIDFIQNVEQSTNTNMVIDIYYNISRLKPKPGCVSIDDFAVHHPTRNGDEDCIKPQQYYAFEQIRDKLNNSDCNQELKCDQVFDLTPQPTKFLDAFSIEYVKIAFHQVDITSTTPGANCYNTGSAGSCDFDANLWHSTNPNECATASQIDTWLGYTVGKSVTYKPTFAFPNSTSVVSKSISSYEFSYWWNEPQVFNSSYLVFGNLSNGEMYHNCKVFYAICVKMPKYPIATKDNTSWRQTI